MDKWRTDPNTDPTALRTLTAVSMLCLSASVLAGPAPMFMMIHGHMMMVTPMTKDMKLKNGCKVCMNGAVISATGEKMRLKEGDMVSAEGVIMPPTLHGLN